MCVYMYIYTSCVYTCHVCLYIYIKRTNLLEPPDNQEDNLRSIYKTHADKFPKGSSSPARRVSSALMLIAVVSAIRLSFCLLIDLASCTHTNLGKLW